MMVHRMCGVKKLVSGGGARIMRIVQVFLVVLGVFLLSGCGDQFWCGEDGCGKRCTSQRCINSDDSLGL
jgi:hypothetical protein